MSIRKRKKRFPSPVIRRIPGRKRRRTSIVISLLLILIVTCFALFLQRDAVINILREWLGRASIPGGETGVASLKLPPGFEIDVFAQGFTDPRFMAVAPDGTLFLAERGADRIVALPDPQHTGKAAERRVVVEGLNNPSSLIFHDGMLYIGEESQVSRFTLDEQHRVTEREVVIPDLPEGGNHITRTVLIGPDNMLYVSVGSTCNVCQEEDERRAAIWVYNLDGSDGHLYARGLRNAVGMAVNPWNDEIWVTNNGRDYLGDDSPPETIYALEDDGDYGWPHCHAGDIIDPEFGQNGSCEGVIPPLAKMQAHSAPLGLTFYNNDAFPQEYQGLFVAFHGSWNRSEPTGFKVVFVPLDEQGNISGQLQDFATGWLINEDNRSGRPTDVVAGPDGSLYVSDDAAGLIYRITYTG